MERNYLKEKIIILNEIPMIYLEYIMYMLYYVVDFFLHRYLGRCATQRIDRLILFFFFH